MKRISVIVLGLNLLFLPTIIRAQETKSEENLPVQKQATEFTDVGVNNLEKTNLQVIQDTYKKNAKIGFFFTGGYSFALSDQTSATGSYLPVDSDEATNDFFLRYARINGAYNITPKLKANLLFNLADFKKDDVSRRVLEIASITYQFNPMFNIRFGQFRPYFGVEDTYGVANHLSNYWSNTYLVMGGSHWQSFQIGASLYGNLEKKDIPLKYYLNVYNGNGKNQITDNDSNKNISGRLVLTAIPGVEIGANYAVAEHLKESTNAYAFDFKTSHDLTSEWTINSEFNYASGHNIKDALRLDILPEQIDDHEFEGWYILPQLVYNVNKPNIESVAFSCRYESLKSNTEVDNKRTTITPMVDFNLSKDFRASIVGIINDYDKENADTGIMDTQYMQIQLQFNY